MVSNKLSAAAKANPAKAQPSKAAKAKATSAPKAQTHSLSKSKTKTKGNAKAPKPNPPPASASKTLVNVTPAPTPPEPSDTPFPNHAGTTANLNDDISIEGNKAELEQGTPAPKDKDVIEVLDSSEEEEEEIEEDVSDTEVGEDGERLFVTNHWDGDKPYPVRQVARLFATNSILAQLKEVEIGIKYDNAKNPTVAITEFEEVAHAFITAVPGTERKVKVMYNLMRADDKVFADTEVKDCILALSGEFTPNLSIPTALVLPANALQARKGVKVPEGEHVKKFAPHYSRRLD